jgi:hypothetical protein
MSHPVSVLPVRLRSLLLILLSLVLTGLWGCQANPPAERMLYQIEQAHGIKSWQKKSALQCDLLVTFGDDEFSRSQLLFTTDGHHVRMDKPDSTILIWDGKEAWITPKNSPGKNGTV